MNPKAGFDAALGRANHLLELYDLIRDTSQRRIRNDWKQKVQRALGWPLKEELVRIYGKEKRSLLLIREGTPTLRDKFAHEYISELLRAAIVAAVSALDRYLHDLVVKHCWKLLGRKDDEIPRELRELSVPAIAAKRAVVKLKRDPSAQPGRVIKQEIQAHLHREYTFQNPDSVLRAVRMLGVSDFWSKVAEAMPGQPEKQEVIRTLRTIAHRRNQIVHEADLLRRTQASKPRLRDVKATQAREWIDWMHAFGSAIDEITRTAV